VSDLIRGVKLALRYRAWIRLAGAVARIAPAAWRKGTEMNVGDKHALKSGTVLGTITAFAAALAVVCENWGPIFRAVERLDLSALPTLVGLGIAALGAFWALIRSRVATGRGIAETQALRDELAALRQQLATR